MNYRPLFGWSGLLLYGGVIPFFTIVLTAHASVVFSTTDPGQQLGLNNAYVGATTTAQISVASGVVLYSNLCFAITGSPQPGNLIQGDVANDSSLGSNFTAGFTYASNITTTGSYCFSATTTASTITAGTAYWPYMFVNGMHVGDGLTLQSIQIGTTPADAVGFIGPTHITALVPAQDDTVATSTAFSLEAIAWINANDIDPDIIGDPTQNLFIQWQIKSISGACDTGVIAVGCFFDPTYGVIATKDVFLFGTSSQSVIVSSTTPIGLPTGIYRLTGTIQKRTSSFFGLFSSSHTLASKSLTFNIGSPSIQQQAWANVANQALSATSTAALQSSCLPIPGSFNVSDCVFLLFVPQTRPDFAGMFSPFASRAPFAYWSMTVGELSSSTASTTGSVSNDAFAGAAILEPYLSPLRTVETTLLWFLFVLYLFRRLSRWEFQA